MSTVRSVRSMCYYGCSKLSLMDYLPAIFGLLDPKPDTYSPLHDFDFENGLDLGSFKYVIAENHVALKCQCGRHHEPYLIKRSLFDKIHPTQGRFACFECLSEQRNAKTIKDHLKMILTQNKLKIEEDTHIVLDFHSDKVYDPIKNQMVRVKRVVYELYYDVKLKTSDKVLVTCGNKNCVSPRHLLVASSPAVKVTPEIKSDIHAWALSKMTNNMIRTLVAEKYQRSISLRTIINVKKSLAASANSET